MAAGLNKAHTTVDNGGGPGTEASPAWPCRITVPSSTRKRRRTPVWKFVRQGPPPGPRPTFANPYSISSSGAASVFAWGSRAGDRKKGTRTTPHHTPQTEEAAPIPTHLRSSYLGSLAAPSQPAAMRHARQYLGCCTVQRPKYSVLALPCRCHPPAHFQTPPADGGLDPLTPPYMGRQWRTPCRTGPLGGRDPWMGPGTGPR